MELEVTVSLNLCWLVLIHQSPAAGCSDPPSSPFSLLKAILVSQGAEAVCISILVISMK
jgi:hypothetical protein